MNKGFVLLLLAVLSLYVLPVNVCAEMMPNGDFESDMNGWGSWGSGSGSGSSGYKWTQHWAVIEPTGGSDGGQFINLTTASQIGYYEWWGWGYNVIWRNNAAELVPVTPGDSVKMGAYGKDLTGTGGNIEFVFEWQDQFGVGGGGVTGTVPPDKVSFPLSTIWTWYEATVLIPANATTIRPVFSNPDPGTQIGLDRVFFELIAQKKANGPVPANNTSIIDLDLVLQWEAPGLLVGPTYNVYFGSEPGSLSQAAAGLVGTSFDPCGPGDLDEGTKYIWRVDVYDPNIGGSPAIYTGDEWSFTTLTWPAFCPVGDWNGDCMIDIKDLLLVAQQWLSTTDMPDFAALSNNWLGGVGGPVVISEIVASNGNTLDDSDGDSADWIELYNLTDSEVNLAGWSLKDEIDQWYFPGGMSLGGHEFLVVFASDKNRSDPNELHTNFKLSSDGEYLALVKDDETIAHAFGPNFPRQSENISYGLFKNKEYYFGQATPGSANVNEVYEGLVKDTEFSVKRGFYETPFDVTITCETDGATVYYTLDGTEPNQSSFEYTSSVSISATTCLRAKAFRSGWMPTNTDTQTYILNASALIKSLPVISIVGDAQKTLYEPDGIMAIVGGYYDNGWWTSDGPDSYNNPMQRGRVYERPVSVELIEPVDNSGFQIDCGIRVQGSNYHRPHYTRGDNWFNGSYNKFSFKLYFRSDYGDAKLHYQMFPRESLDVFDRLVLRGGHNDSVNPFVRDELIRRLHNDMGGVSSSGTFANIFINGVYKAYYNPCEYLDEEFFQSWYDSDDKWDVITQRTLRDGTSAAWNEMLNYVDGNDLSDPNHYQEMGNRLDVQDFVDYLIVQLYSANWDWPANNWTAAREQSAEGRFRFYVWDAEGAMDSWVNLNLTGFDDFPSWTSPAGLNNLTDPMSRIYRGLKANADFKILFADRIHKFFFNNGALVNSNVEARFFELRDEMLGVLPSIDTYISDTFIPGRRDPMLNKFVSEGLFTYDPTAPSFNINGSYQHGGTADYGDTLSIINPNPSGTAYYTTDGSDPRLSGGGINPSALVMNDILISQGSEWSYLDDGSDQGTGWREGSISWSSGPAQLGYGDGDESTTVSYGGNASNKYITTYFRKTFSVSDSFGYSGLTVKLLRDDGAVVYINGQEVVRHNMPGTPGVNDISYTTPASVVVGGADESTFYSFARDPSVLVDGDNIIAVEIHQISGGSSDISFDLELTATRTSVTLTESTTVKARILNGVNWSPLNEATYGIGPVARNLRITEIMYHPPAPNQEYIELKNIGTETLNLALVKFTDGIEFTFPSVQLASCEHVVVVQDQGQFEAKYGPGVNIAGQFTGSLSNAGEDIKLEDALGETILEFEYSDDWFDMTDGAGFSLTVRDPNNADPNGWSDKKTWRPSAAVGGSPGWDDTGVIPQLGAIVINELLAHSDTEVYDWIELYNTTGSTLNIGGWFLSDNNDDDPNRMKYEIATGTTIGPNGYVVFYENLHFGNPADPGCHRPFQFSENGETVYLQSGQDGVLTGYYDEEDFGASEQDIAFGRYYKASTDTYNFVAMSSNTPNGANAYPKVGPIIINEIMYHPQTNSDAEYIELLNISGSSITLYIISTGEPWQFVDDAGDPTPGLEFYFPSGSPITMVPGEYLLLVKDLAAFNSEFTGEPGVTILEWITGSLSNGGEEPLLSIPGDLDNGVRQYIRIDKVNYDDEGLWPTGPDGNGGSLTRKNSTQYGNDVANWKSASPTPGSINP